MEDQHIISDNFVTCNSNYEIVAYLCVDAFRRCDEDDSVRRLVLRFRRQRRRRTMVESLAGFQLKQIP